jgi:hypothetical protein
LDTFEIIGEKINKLEIKESQGYKNPFLEVLQRANDVKELVLKNLKINENAKSVKCKEVDIKKCTFPELSSLELEAVMNFGIVKEAFDAVDSLHHLKLSTVNLEEWPHYQQILFKQKDLQSLILDKVEVGSFEVRNWKIEKLVLTDVKFPGKEVFQTFVSFIKTLQNISELELGFNDDEFRNGNNYKEILEHLLNLPSLIKLKWSLPKSALNIHNPFVNAFASKNIRSEIYSEVFRYFPNIETFELPLIFWSSDLIALKARVNLRELKFNYIDKFKLERINCPQIQKVSFDGDMRFKNSNCWKIFVQRHPNIEYVELKAHNKRKCSGPHFIVHFKDLPALKTLKYYNRADTLQIAKLIGDNLAGLEHLEIVMLGSNVVEAVEYLRLKFPHLGCDSKRFQKITEGSWDWLITLRKF